MNCQANLQSRLELAQNCVLQVIRSCVGWIPCLPRRQQVHPAASHPFADSHFIQLNSHRRIRVVHINANARKSSSGCMNGVGQHVETMQIHADGCHYNLKHRNLSLISNDSELSSEDYWFTRWNRPLRMEESCNCSFRKSWRNSLEDSREILNEMQDNPKDSTDQMLCSLTPCEKYVGQEGLLQSRSHKLLQIENFVEEVLKEVWNEVFSCLSQTGHDVCNQSQLKLECMPNCINRHHDKDLEHNHMCRKRSEPLDDYESRNDCFNFQTVFSCHETKNCHVVETINKNLKGTNDQLLVSTSLNSVGCVNPAFLGSSLNPDVVECAVQPGAPPVECDAIVSSKGLPAIVKKGTKLFDTIDSDANIVSESSSHCISNIDCCKIASEHSVLDQHACITEKTETESFTATPNEINLTELQAHISSGSHLSDKMTEAKDDTQEYNQTSFTSIDVRLQDTNRTQASSSTDGGPKSQKSNVQQRRNKPCFHTKNLKRLKPLLYFLHGVGCSAELWSALLHHFTAAGYDVLAPDMLGHGYSAAPDKASAYTFHRLLKDSIDIFDRFVGEHRKCVVIGHAYGCSLAAAVARYRAQQVSHLVLISGGGPAPLAPRRADSHPPSVSPCLLACMRPLLMCGFRRNILYAPCGKHIESCPSMSKGIPHYVLHHVAQGQDWPEGDATFHRRILAPTLLVHGLQDPYVTLVQECEMERTIPRSFLELIPDAGHLSMLETPAHLCHMIHCFIDWWSR